MMAQAVRRDGKSIIMQPIFLFVLTRLIAYTLVYTEQYHQHCLTYRYVLLLNRKVLTDHFT